MVKFDEGGVDVQCLQLHVGSRPIFCFNRISCGIGGEDERNSRCGRGREG